MGEIMYSSNALTLNQPLSRSRFDRLHQLLQQTAQQVDGILLTEAVLPSRSRTGRAVDRVVLVVSPTFRVLLQGRLAPDDAATSEAVYHIDLTFDALTIDQWLDQFLPALPSELLQSVAQIRLHAQPDNDAHVQSQFTLGLIAALCSDTSDTTEQAANSPAQKVAPSIAYRAVQFPKQEALHQQIEQERLLNQVTAQIRQSLDLPVILQTAVEQVRNFLQVDRLVIYYMNPEATSTATEITSDIYTECLFNNLPDSTVGGHDPRGSVVFESRASSHIPSVLYFSDVHCFLQNLRQHDRQTWQFPLVVEDVEAQYAHSLPCLLEFLRQAQVRAKLIAPIWLDDRLWGLLIAHDCSRPRQWQANEQRFLQQIAEHLAIAVQQAHLYQQLQQQKQTLEQRVIERTQALEDTMLAAQAADRAKNEFLATVSHELRTPLACIIGMSTTLQRWSGHLLDDRQRHFLQIIHDSGEQLLNLINDILDLSQVEAGKGVLNLCEFSLSHLAQQTLKTFETQARLHQIELEPDLHIAPERDRFIADPRRVRQVLYNLLANAVKFTAQQGRVTLQVFAEADQVIFRVKDTGIGIPAEQIPLLFKKFQQLDAGYHRQYSGTGLGLALTKQLVELQGGWIEVDSTVGMGSVFTVRLPVQQPSVAVTNRDRSTLISQQPQGRIVLIEHVEETAHLICDLLTTAGYQVVWMLESSRAISQIEVLRPLVVIVEMALPDIDGQTLIQSLRCNPATKPVKVIALSSEAVVLEDWQTIGADALLHNPIHPEELLQKVIALAATPYSLPT
ncbi:MAG TPA: ATP-binding protein [Trichocoleus sp.]|jgi:two-component system sensor histidine kinase/response regulator